MAGMNQERLMSILLEPRVSEKSTMVADKNNQFVFKVAGGANKQEIKQAVEKMFAVEVASVQICNVKGKSKLFKYQQGSRQGWKKAYVKLKPGFDIDFLGAQ
jgi:large subunit ribosomal protein L23